jgi:hypothetical protein
MRYLIIAMLIAFFVTALDSQVREKFKGEQKGKEKKEQPAETEGKTEQPTKPESEKPTNTGNLIFFDNFAQYSSDEDISAKWEIEDGSVDIKTLKGKKWMHIFSRQLKARPVINRLPEKFKIEFELIPGSETTRISFLTAHEKELNYVDISHWEAKSEKANTYLNLTENVSHKVEIEVKGNLLKCAINGRTAIIEQRAFEENVDLIKIKAWYPSLNNPIYITNFAVYDLTR